MDGVVLDGPQGTGSVAAEVDVIAGRLRCGEGERAVSNRKLPGSGGWFRTAKSSTMDTLSTILTRASWSAMGRTPSWPPQCGGCR